MNCKEFLNISGFIKNFSLASFCCKTTIYMQNPVQKSRTDYFFPHLPDVFSFQLISFFFFFQWNLFTPNLTLCQTSVACLRSHFGNKQGTRFSHKTQQQYFLSVHEAHCKCRQHTSITKHKKCSSCCWKHSSHPRCSWTSLFSHSWYQEALFRQITAICIPLDSP